MEEMKFHFSIFQLFHFSIFLFFNSNFFKMVFDIYTPMPIQELGQRLNQEDSIWPPIGKATAEDRLFMVCDGMGGHDNGELASATVCNALGLWFRKNVNPDAPFNDDMLRSALEYAYCELDALDNGSARKPGTTLTLLYLHKGGITAAHMGDSRIYHIRPGEGIKYISRDHSVAFELFQSGEITYEEMLAYPQKNIVTRAMMPGEDNRSRADIIHITDVAAGDYFLLCSDGLLEQLANKEILDIFSSGGSDEEIRRYLIDITANNHDNHSAYIIHVRKVTLTDDEEDTLTNEEPKSRYNQLNIIPKEYL